MEIFNLNMAAGEVKEQSLVGNYFELRNALYSVDIELLDKTGAVVNLLKGALESDFVESRLYETVRITNGGTAQTVKFWYGVGSAGSRRFSGSVTGTIALDATTLAALEYIQVRPEIQTGKWSDNAAVVANTAKTIFLPSANTAGALILSASASWFDNSGVGVRASFALISSTVAPATITDGSCIVASQIGGLMNGTLTYFTNNFELKKTEIIPAGEGLYFISNLALPAEGASFRACRYRLL